LVIEYKGQPYETNADSKEKINIGELWQSRSTGKGFAFYFSATIHSILYFTHAKKTPGYPLNIIGQF
jgi:hypothetical protein